MKAITKQQAIARIRADIRKSGKTQTAYAEAKGIDKAILSNVLNGRRDPNRQILRALGLEQAIVYVEAER